MKYLFLLLAFVTSYASAQPVQTVANTYDIATAQNLTTYDIFYTNAMQEKAVHSGKVFLYMNPQHRWHLTESNMQVGDNMFMLGASIKGIKNIVIDKSYKGKPMDPVFVVYGHSNYGFIGMSTTGIDNSVHIGAFVQCNAVGADINQKNTNILFLNNDASNFWCDDYIRMGSSIGGMATNDLVKIMGCDFSNIYAPGYQIFHDEEDAYHSGFLCDAIDNEQTTLREEVSGCTFTNISGRAGAGYGWGLNATDTIAPVLTYGNWYWHNNYFAHCFKFLEFNGGALMRGIRVEDNVGFDWTADFGHATSLTGYETISRRNKYTGFDRGAAERYGIGGTFADTLNICKYYPGCGGTPVVKWYQTRAVAEGGFSHTNSDTIGFYGYSKDDKERRMTYILTGKDVISDNQPRSWKGQTNGGMIVFDNVHAGGGNAPFIGGEVEPFDSIVIRANCKYTSSTQNEMVIEMLGSRWLVRAFSCDLRGSLPPRNEQGLIGFSSLQKGGATGSKVGKINLYNAAWNKFLTPSSYSYSSPTIKK